MLRGLPSSNREVGTKLPYSCVSVSVGLFVMEEVLSSVRRY
jgi:hypothetical protein